MRFHTSNIERPVRCRSLADLLRCERRSLTSLRRPARTGFTHCHFVERALVSEGLRPPATPPAVLSHQRRGGRRIPVPSIAQRARLPHCSLVKEQSGPRQIMSMETYGYVSLDIKSGVCQIESFSDVPSDNSSQGHDLTGNGPQQQFLPPKPTAHPTAPWVVRVSFGLAETWKGVGADHNTYT